MKYRFLFLLCFSISCAHAMDGGTATLRRSSGSEPDDLRRSSGSLRDSEGRRALVAAAAAVARKNAGCLRVSGGTYSGQPESTTSGRNQVWHDFPGQGYQPY